jgi:hypothetical protein
LSPSTYARPVIDCCMNSRLSESGKMIGSIAS